MNINELTLGQIKEIQSLKLGDTSSAEHPYAVGKNYFIRTVTHHYTGTLIAVYPAELVLAKAAWIADDGRLTQALATETFSEVEIYPIDQPVIIGRGSILDAVQIKVIPTSQK
jgi:hypothetical protein